MQSSKVIKIKKIGVVPTVDIEVNHQSHIFYGNGIATSNSHSYSYAAIGEYTAYAKAHFPLHFFTSFLQHAEDKLDKKQEIKELIEDLTNFDIKIAPPKLTNSIIDNYGRFCMNNKYIDFGLASIKGLGKSHISKLYTAIKTKIDKIKKPIEKFTWIEFLCEICPLINSTTVDNLILVGATPDQSVARKRKVLEYVQYCMLSDRELKWINENYKMSLLETLKEYINIDKKNGGPFNDKRKNIIIGIIESLSNPSYNLTDSPEWMVNNERELLGISLSYNAIETKNISTGYTCKDFNTKKNGKIRIVCELSTVKQTITKNGKNPGQSMAFLTIKDSFDKVNAVCFPETYNNYASLLFEGNVVICEGIRSPKDEGLLIINDVKQL